MKNVEKVEEQKKKNLKNLKKILVGALTGWLMFSMSIAVSCGNISDLLYVPRIWSLSLPGALFGALAGILMAQKTNKETSQSETLESKIKDLKKLLDEGLLTQEEFDEQKKKILNS